MPCLFREGEKMKKYSRLVPVLFLSLAIAGISPPPSRAMDKNEVEKIIQEYLSAHPEEVAAAMRKFQMEQRIAQQEAEIRLALRNRVDVPVGDSPAMGPDNAPITIVEFSDFQCPYCARSVATVHTLMERHKGRARLVFKHSPLAFHAKAPQAHRASMAAGEQGKFWEYRQALMAKQDDWGKANDSRARFIAYAGDMGMDAEKFAMDMDNPEFQKRLEADQELGLAMGVQGTPTYFVNGAKVVGAQDLAYFEKVIKAVTAARPEK